MMDALAAARAEGVGYVAFGDLFLADVRAYREKQLAGTGVEPLFPLWQRDTHQLAREMVKAGVRAILTCVDPRRLDRSFAGRAFDGALLAALPADVDPCGEAGEFHTCVTAGPMLRSSLNVMVGELVEREGLVFADVVPATAPASCWSTR